MNMLVDSKKRFSAEDALNHPWTKKIKNLEKREENVLNLNYKSLVDYSKMNKFKKIVLNFIASRINNEEISQLNDIFIAMDTNEDGFITFEELESAFKKLNVNDVNLKEIFNEMDVDKTGLIKYTEFLAATIDEVSFLKEESLFEAFRMFDEDKSGKISVEEIAQAVNTKKEDFESLKEEVQKYDLNGDGEIDYLEFCNMMGKEIRRKSKLIFGNFFDS